MATEIPTISSTAARYSQMPSVASSVAQPRQVKRDPSPPLRGADASPSLKRLLGDPKVMDGPMEAKRRKLEYAFKGSEFPLGRTRTENTEPAKKFQSVHEGRYEDFAGFRDRLKYKSRALPNLNPHNASGSNQHPSQDTSRPTVKVGPLSSSEASFFTWDSPLFRWDSSFVPWDSSLFPGPEPLPSLSSCQPQNSSTANRPKRTEDSGLNTPSSPPTSSNIDNLMSGREHIQLAAPRASLDEVMQIPVLQDSFDASPILYKSDSQYGSYYGSYTPPSPKKFYRRPALDHALTNQNVGLGGKAVDYTISEDRTGDPGEEKRRCLAVLAKRPGVLRLYADKASKVAVDRESARAPARNRANGEVGSVLEYAKRTMTFPSDAPSATDRNGLQRTEPLDQIMATDDMLMIQDIPPLTHAKLHKQREQRKLQQYIWSSGSINKIIGTSTNCLRNQPIPRSKIIVNVQST
ncbi:hypothetical protein LTS15_000141 [Exophiala xenobiotica]|nr:hypothetical protein LTS15_000141 [Exophiala xenobiotica]